MTTVFWVGLTLFVAILAWTAWHIAKSLWDRRER